MSAASMWTAMQAAIAAVTPYQGSDPVASAAYRAAVGQAMCTAIISEQNSPVAWDGTNDRVLDVGQFTSDSFTSATSMPLHIACGDGQMYEMRIVGSYTAAPLANSTYLQPNNTIPSTNSFTYRQDNGSGSTPASSTGTSASNGFYITGGNASILESVVDIFTSTLTKRTIAVGGATNTSTSYVGTIVAEWQDTTTVWSSIGTITMPNSWSGQIVCRRIA